MRLLESAETILSGRADLQEIANSKYEFSVEDSTGKQLALERRDSKDSLRLHLQGLDALDGVSLSSSTKVEKLNSSIARVHLKASKLCGPYDGSKGNDALRVTVETRKEFVHILESFYGP